MERTNIRFVKMKQKKSFVDLVFALFKPVPLMGVGLVMILITVVAPNHPITNLFTMIGALMFFIGALLSSQGKQQIKETNKMKVVNNKKIIDVRKLKR